MTNWARFNRSDMLRYEGELCKISNKVLRFFPKRDFISSYVFLTTLILGLLYTPTAINAQEYDKTISYVYDNSIFPNPERGLMECQTFSYKWTQITSDAESEKLFKAKSVDVGKTIIWRYYTLVGYHDKMIPEAYLKFVEKDFDLARKYGVKIIPRFVYSTNTPANGPWDAPLDTVLLHIDQVAPIIQKNSDIIVTWQAGWIGRHGEWAGTTHYGDYFDVTYKDSLNMGKRRAVIQKMLEVLPENRTISMRYPKDKQGCTYPYLKIQTDTITKSDAYSNEFKSRVGYFNDSYLASIDDRSTYRPKNIREELKSHVKGDTKYVPFGGETSAFWTTDYYQPDSIYKLSDEYNLSYLHSNYHPDVIKYWKDQNVWDSLTKRLGYRFYLEDFSYNTTSNTNSVFNYKMKIQNRGFTSPFNPRDCEFVFIGARDTVRMKVDEDPRFWQVGTNIIEGTINLDSKLSKGTYSIFLNLPDPETRLNNDPRYSIRLANIGIWDKNTGYNKLNASISIADATPISKPTISCIYPDIATSNDKVAIDASKSFDPENRDLSYSWKYPTNFEIIQENEKLIFFAPEVEETTEMEITLTVSNGKVNESKTFNISVKPVLFGSNLPEIFLNFNTLVYGGRLETLDASAYVNSVKDERELLINWITPEGIEISSSKEPIITYLAPDIEEATSLKFYLEVTQNGVANYKSFDVNVDIYKPYAKKVDIIGTTASSYESNKLPRYLFDEDLNTYWLSNGLEEWVELELAEETKPEFIKVSFENSQTRIASFDVYTLTDDGEWRLARKNLMSCGYSNNTQIFDLPSYTGEGMCKKIKIVTGGNSVDENNSFAEIEVYGISSDISASKETKTNDKLIFPNPAIDFINLTVNSFMTGRILSTDGKVIIEFNLDEGNNLIAIDQLTSGIYFLQLTSVGNMTTSHQLIVL